MSTTPITDGAASRDGLATTQWLTPGIELDTISVVALSPDIVYYAPILLRGPMTLDTLVSVVTTASVAGGKGRVGIYEANTDWNPGDLVIQSAEFAIDTTGQKAMSVGNFTIGPGLYLTAIQLSAAATMRGWCGGSRYFGVDLTMGSSLFTARGSSVRAFDAGGLPSVGEPMFLTLTSTTPPQNFVLMRGTAANVGSVEFGQRVAPGRAKGAGAANGQLIVPGVELQVSGAVSLVGGTVYYMPCEVEVPITTDALYLEVTALAAGSTAKMGIATADDDWQPVDLVDTTADLSTASVGVKVGTLASPKTLDVGRHLLMIRPSHNISIRRANSANRAHGAVEALGTTPYVYTAQAVGGAMTDPPPRWAYGATTIGIGAWYGAFLSVSDPNPTGV